jgi:ammonia channel protein AmtB
MRYGLLHMQAALCTIFAGAVGGVVSALLCSHSQHTWKATSTVPRVVTGVLAALVASTCSCSIAPVWTQAVSACIAATLARWATWLLRRAGVDDVTNVVPVHLCGGIVSVITVAFFAQPQLLQQLPSLPSREAVRHSAGLAFGGNTHQLIVQLVWLLIILLWSLVITVPMCLLLRSLGCLRNDTNTTSRGASQTACSISFVCPMVAGLSLY